MRVKANPEKFAGFANETKLTPDRYNSRVSNPGLHHEKNSLRPHHAMGAVLSAFKCPGKRRDRAPSRKHRHQSAGLSGTSRRAGLSGLLRPGSGCELFLL